MSRKILFIANPKSRSIDKMDLDSEISRLAEKYNFNWEIYFTLGDNDDQVIRQKLQKFKPDKVVAVGGDGTINLVASHLINSKTGLGIIPAGSANGLAFNLNIPRDIEEAMTIILETEPNPIDVIKINNKSYCLHLCDIGINARIVKRFEDQDSKGLLGYGKQRIKEFFSERKIFAFNINTPSMRKRYRAEMIVIANAKSFGTGAVINPSGLVNDGKFEIIIIQPYPMWIIFYLLYMSFVGKTDKLKYVKIITATEAQIILDKPHDLQTDGEIIEGLKKINFEILKSALKVHFILPE